MKRENLVTVSVILLHLGVQLDHGINTHNGNAGFDGTLELLDLAHAGFQNTGLHGVMDTALRQVETVVAVRLLLGDSLLFLVGVTFLDALGESVADTELGNELG